MTDTKAEELLPVTLKACPFCGGKAVEQRAEKGPTGERYRWVECGDCGAMSTCCDDSARANNPDEPEPIAAWNHRIDSQAELVEAVKEIDALTRDGRDIVSRQVSRVTSRLIARLGTPS